MTIQELPPAPPMPRRTPEQTRRRIRIALIVVLVLLLAAIGAAIWWVVSTNNSIERLPEEATAGLVAPVTDATTILIVGTDSRENIGELEGRFGNFGGSRTDVIMLARIDPDTGIHLLSIPRDLYVDLPGYERNRINTAIAFGGADLLIQTVQQELGVDINHYVEIDFAGFANIVDSLGGVTYDFDFPARDRKSGLEVDAGRVTLDGPQALAYVRSRQYQELRDGDWRVVGGSDIGRTRRQQRLMLALFDEATSRSNPLDLQSFASTVADQITVDSGLSLGRLIELGRVVLDLESKNIQTATLPVEGARIDGRDVVVPIVGESQAVLEAFANGSPYPE